MIEAPQESDSFGRMKAIDRAIILRDYLAYLERITNDTKATLDAALREAAENKEETDDFYVQVKYATGKTLTPDADLFKERFPAKYHAWILSEQEAFRPRLTKKALESMWTTEGSTAEEKKRSREKNTEEMKSIMVEKDANPQYTLARIADRGKWK